MLSHCSNSQCGKPFLRLGEGKLFQLQAEYAASRPTGARSPHSRKPPRRVERYWLCDACTGLWTLVQDRNSEVSLMPLPLLPAGTPATSAGALAGL